MKAARSGLDLNTCEGRCRYLKHVITSLSLDIDELVRLSRQIVSKVVYEVVKP